MAVDYKFLYQNGIIASWYLRESQIALYNLLKKKKRIVCNCHRRFGKGTSTLVYVFERAITEKLIIRYGAPTQKQAYDILTILIDHIYSKVPDLKPKLVQGSYFWRSGSVMHVFGVKDESELDKARGTEAHIIVCDEYGFWRYKPSYVLRSVLSPQVDETDGQIIITSTPPEDLTHPYITEELPGAEALGNLFRWDIDDSIRLGDITQARHDKIIERCGGAHTEAYKREYKLSLIASRSRLVIPEVQETEIHLGTQAKPDYLNWFAVCDLGLKDFFHMLWGYPDFVKGTLVIVKEFCANYLSTKDITDECKRIEKSLGINPKNIRRLGDSSDLQQLFDMSKDHDYAIAPIIKRSKTNTGFKESVINGLRLALPAGRILIDQETCPMLCVQLKYGLWNERRTDFERSERLGHLDGMMALAYMWNNVDLHTNPYPILAPGITERTHFIDPALKKARNEELKALIGM